MTTDNFRVVLLKAGAKKGNSSLKGYSIKRDCVKVGNIATYVHTVGNDTVMMKKQMKQGREEILA